MPSVQEPVGDVMLRTDEDVLRVRPSGVLSMEQAQRITHAADAVSAQYGHYFLLGDLQMAGVLPAAQRRLLAEYGARNRPLAAALYNVSPLVRAVNALLFGAMNMLGQTRLNVMQFSTEKAALEWIRAERERLRGTIPFATR